jgi:hypothetical protein
MLGCLPSCFYCWASFWGVANGPQERPGQASLLERGRSATCEVTLSPLKVFPVTST